MSNTAAMIDRLNDKLYEKDLGMKLLLLYVKTVVDDNECLCGAPPFTDGDQCSPCAGLSLLDLFKPSFEKPPGTQDE